MKKSNEKTIHEWLDNFNMDASVTYKNKVYTLTGDELELLAQQNRPEFVAFRSPGTSGKTEIS